MTASGDLLPHGRQVTSDRNALETRHLPPVYGSQFHCEMTEQDMRQRVMMYAADYMPGEDPLGELGRRLRPTPFADGLLQRFVATYL